MILDFGKFLIFFGFVLVLIGIIFSLFGKIPYLGKLPGDFYLKRENFQLYFPFTSSILISIFVSLILYFISKFVK